MGYNKVMEFFKLIEQRHSVREYKNEKISETVLEKIIAAAKLAPTSRNKKPCDFKIVTSPAELEKLSEAKNAGSQMLKNAAAAIIVFGDSEKSDVWVEDCSIAMTYLHLAATDLGLGSCWIQIRNRKTKTDEDSGKYIKKLFNIEEKMEVLAVLSLGIK